MSITEYQKAISIYFLAFIKLPEEQNQEIIVWFLSI